MFVIAVELPLAEALTEALTDPAAEAEAVLCAPAELLELLHAETRIAATAGPATSNRDLRLNFMGLLYGGGGQIAHIAVGDECCELAVLLFAGDLRDGFAPARVTRL
jgi:hypothetical protein